MGVVPDETGYIEVNENYVFPGGIHVGTSDNIYSNGYISFDITDLAGAEVVSVTLRMDLDRREYGEYGDRSPLGNLRIGTLDYGTGQLSLSARDIPAKMLVQLPNSITDISYSGDELANELQKNIDAASDRFQLKVYWSHPSIDGVRGGLRYLQEDIHLTVQYTE